MVDELEVMKCKGTTNRECKSCPNNTYLDIDKMCKNCTFCEQGFAKPCNSTRDAVCKKAKMKPDSFKQETIIIAVSVSVLLISAIFGIVCLRRYRIQGEETVPEEHDVMNPNGNTK